MLKKYVKYHRRRRALDIHPSYKRRNNRLGENFENLPKRESFGLKWSHDRDKTTGLPVSLHYAEKWLRKQLGRNWNDIFREIIRQYPDTQQSEILLWFVYFLHKIDGQLYLNNTPLYLCRWVSTMLYVDPDTNLLCEYSQRIK